MRLRLSSGAALAALAFAGWAGEAKVLPETLFIVQTQLYPWREQARGYLMRYPNQPLLVEPDLPYDKGEEGIDHWIDGWGSFPSQADYDRTVSLVKDYGMDGLQIFWGRPPKSFLAARDCPVRDYVVLPICMGFKELGPKFRAGIENALANDRKCMVGGRMLLGAYWTDKYCTPADFKRVTDQIRAEYGDKFLFMAEVDGVDSFRREFWRDGALSEGSVRKMEEHIREWARVADAVKCGQSSPVVAHGERSERVCSTEFTRLKFEILSRVLDEPEFRGRKLKVLGAIQGHMNSYMKGHNVVEDCTRTMRRCCDNALAFDPDVVIFAEWDEFNENTHFMPTLYSSWTLKRIMRYYAAKAKGRPLTPVPGDDVSMPNLVVSFRKCLSPGERLTVEVLNVPDGSRSGRVETRIDILDDAGRVVKALEPRTLDETELAESRYELDSAELAPLSRALQVRLSYRDASEPGASFAAVGGFHPVNLAPANSWDHVCARQPIRDLPSLEVSRAEVADGMASLAVSCDEPIRYAMLCGNGCIQYIQGRPGEPENLFRDGGDWAVFQVSPICTGRYAPDDGEPPYLFEVPGVEDAEWLYVRECTKGSRLELRALNRHATPPVYLRVPKARLAGAALRVECADARGGLDFRCEIPLDEAWRDGAYAAGKSMKGMTVTATRFPLQCRYPRVANADRVSFSVPVDADRSSMFYHFQLVTMSGKTWRSRPFVFEKSLGEGRIRCWSAMQERAVAVDLPRARIPDVAYDFAPRGGNVLFASTGERHWNGMLGTPFSPATLWNRGARTEGGATKEEMKAFWDKCDETVPERVQEPDGSWSIEFDGDDYACIPWEMWPTFGGCTVEMDVMPMGGRGQPQSIWANMFGLYDLGIAADGRLRCGFWGFRSGEESRMQYGPELPVGKWTRLKVVNDCEKIEVSMDGRPVLSFPVNMPAMNTLSPILGGVHRDGLGFFRGRLRSLRVSHAAEPRPDGIQLREGGSASGGKAETAAWQAKIDAASAAGGGTVVVPAGTHHVAELELKSNVTLELAEGARLTAVNDYSLYRWQKGVKAELQRTGVLVAYGATNIAVVGKGTVDGGGDREPKTTKRPARWRNVYFEDCRGVEIRDVKLENPAFWTCFLRRCSQVHVKGVTVRALSNYNNDGLDLCVSEALVEGCDIISEDDAIVMKNFDADWVSEKVEIRNCRVSSNASYIKFGTETHGVIRDFDIHDCEISARAASFWRRNCGSSEWPGLVEPKHGTGGLVFLTVDGGVLENVRVRDIAMVDGVCVPLVFRLGRRNGRENWRRSAMRGITLERIRMASPALCGIGNFISGVPGMDIADVTIRDSSFKMQALPGAAGWRDLFLQEREAANPGAGIFKGPMPAHFLYARHARDVRLENVSVEVVGDGETRPAVVADDHGAVSVRGCVFGVEERDPAPPAVLDDEGIVGLVHPDAESRDLSLKQEWRGLFRTFRSTADGSVQPFYWYDPGVPEPVPLVVALHSWGASCHWSSPAKTVLDYCRKRGCAMVYPNCRGPNVRPEACGSDLAVQDALDAIEWAKAVRRIDADRVYVVGGSGGGYMTLLLAGLHPQVFAGAAAFCPITDLARWHGDSRARGNHYADNLEACCGGLPDDARAEYARRSPLTHLANARAAGLPVYIVTGIHDGHRGSVPVGHAVRAFNALADEKDRVAEGDIAYVEANERPPESLAFSGDDPFYTGAGKVLMRTTSANARLTVFDGGHDGNYPAGLDFLMRQRRGRPADFTLPELPETAGGGCVEEITK